MTTTRKKRLRATSPPPAAPEILRRYRYYVRHPPPDELSPDAFAAWVPTILEYNLPFDTWAPLKCLEDSYQQTKNPVLVIQAFLIAHRAKLYAPLWVLDALAEGFQRFEDMGFPADEFSLNRALGLRPDRGKSLPVKLLAEHERDAMLTLDVFRLSVLGHHVTDAVTMVSDRLRSTRRWDRTGLKLAAPSPGYLKDRYYRKWRRVWGRGGTMKAAVLAWTPEARAAFLAQFETPPAQ